MSSSQPGEHELSGDGAPVDTALVDDWIRAHVGRQVIVGCAEDAPAQLRELLARYREVRVETTPAAAAREADVTAGIAAVLRLDPHALLFRVDASSGPVALAASARALYQACEATGALDRCFVALLGVGMTRALARSLAFEDGFALEGDDDERLIRVMTAQAAACEEARRRGSSPPCYL